MNEQLQTHNECTTKESVDELEPDAPVDPNEIIILTFDDYNDNEVLKDNDGNNNNNNNNKLQVPIITWKVKNGSTVRIGEILAHYNFSSSESNYHDNRISSSKNDQDMITTAATIGMEHDQQFATGEVTNTTETVTATTTKRAIIRPRKRNRNGIVIHKQGNNDNEQNTMNDISKTTTTAAANHNNIRPCIKNQKNIHTTMEMDEILKSFQRKKKTQDETYDNFKNENDTATIANNNISTATNTATATADIHYKIRNSNVIKATLDGIVHIYDTIKTRVKLLPLSSPSSKTKNDFNDDDNNNNNNTSNNSNTNNSDSDTKELNPIHKQIIFILGKIEECHHPAVIDNLCAVCGKSVDHNNNNHHTTSNANNNAVKYSQSIYSSQQQQQEQIENQSIQHEKIMNFTQSNINAKISNNNNYHQNHQQQGSNNKRDAFTLSGGVTVSISQDYAQSLSKSTSQSLRSARKLSLVLDLDHTLLHATADRRASKWMNIVNDLHIVLLPLMEGQEPLFNGVRGGGGQRYNYDNIMMPHYVKLRPHLAEFITSLLDKYEISIYTAGTRTYANKIADVISRHVLDYQRRKEGDDGDNNNVVSNNNQKNHDKCLDEGELNDLKQKVARLEERMRWDKSRKERQEYVKKMNEQFELQKQKEQEDKKEGFESDAVTNHDDETIKGNGIRKIRRRVHFSDDVISNDEKIKNDDDSKLKKTKNCTILQSDESEDYLEELKAKLRSAEEKENSAQSLRKKIFGSRIISRTDLPDLGRDVKSLERVCPCGDMAAIVDDREDVWANAENNSTGRKGEPPHNMLLVKPYHFAPFVNFADVNNASGIDLSEQSAVEKKVDDIDESEELQLLWTKDILTRVHDNYYDPSLSKEEQEILTIPSILTKMRRNVLFQSSSPTKVLLSGLVPLHLQNSDSSNKKVPRHNVVRYVEELGGEIMTNISNDVTHVIAAKDGTDKILQARRIPGCSVVRISWLMECYWSISRREIDKHYLGPPPCQNVENSNHDGSSKNLLLIESDTDDDEEEEEDDDDDIFMEFKRRMAELQAKD